MPEFRPLPERLTARKPARSPGFRDGKLATERKEKKMKAKDRRIHEELTGRIPEIQATEGRARKLKKNGAREMARVVQRAFARAERRAVRREPASQALA
jgi:hypothetical protein